MQLDMRKLFLYIVSHSYQIKFRWRSKLKNKFQVNYANCHATSTLAGDLAEINAMKKVFKDTSELKINGTKVSHFICIYNSF